MASKAIFKLAADRAIIAKTAAAPHDPNDYNDPAPEYPVVVKGTITWDLVWNYDNSDNDGSIVETREYKTEQKVSYSVFDRQFSENTRKDLVDAKVGAEAGTSYEGIDAKVTSSLESSSEISQSLQLTTERKQDGETYNSSTLTQTYTIAARSKLALYQQHFTAPGVDVKTSVLNTNPAQLVQEVDISYKARPIRWIQYLQVVYGDNPSQAPDHRVLEINGGNPDINAGFGGKYVWLIPYYTYDSRKAAVRFDLIIQKNSDDSQSDLAKGAGGDFRYLKAVADANNPNKVTDVGLQRSGNSVNFPSGSSAQFTAHTGDINAGRKKDFLYLLWATRYAY